MTRDGFDVALGEANKQAALARVEAANVFWVREAMLVGYAVARRTSRLTTDDIWRALPPIPADVGVAMEPRAMGAVMRNLAGQGTIRATGDYVQSQRAACHRRPLRIWESLIYRP